MLFILYCGYGEQANGAELLDIRTGSHKNYSRLVMQFDSKVSYNVIKDFKNSKLVIEVSPVALIKYLDPAHIDTDDLILNYIEYEHTPPQLTITVHLSIPEVRVVTFSLDYPDRIVIDFYPVNQNLQTGIHNFKEDKPPYISKGLNYDPIFLEHPKYKPSHDTTNTQFESGTTNSSPNSEEVKKEGNRSSINKREALSFISKLKPLFQLRSFLGSKMKEYDLATLFIIVATFILVDSILLTFFVINRKNRRRYLEVRNRKRRINSKSGADFQHQDFKNMLKTSLKSNERESQKASFNVPNVNHVTDPYSHSKIDSMIQSLSEALGPSIIINKPLPGFEEMAKELESLNLSSTIPKELWIGQDGIDFLKNMKKMQVH